MFVHNFAFLCCGLLLLIISSSESQQTYTNNKDEDHHSTIRYEKYADSTTTYSNEIKPLRYDLYERFTNNTQHNEMKYEFSTISTNIDRKDVDSILHKLRRRSAHNQENDDKILKHFHNNSTNVNHKENSTSQKVYENLLKMNDSMSNKVFENFTKNSYEINIVPYETCHNITCIQFCCPFGNIMRWNDTKCIPKEMTYVFPNVYKYTNDSTQNENGRVNEFFQLTVYNTCLESECYVVPDHQYDYKIFANGSFYIPYYETLFKSTSYCLGVFLERGGRFEAFFSSEEYAEFNKNLKHTPEYSWINHIIDLYFSLYLVCMLFLVAVFLVYSILPELRNEHGFMLRNYSAVTSIQLMIDNVRLSNIKKGFLYPACITIAFLEYLCIISSYFWLSIMSFNMWRTFREFPSLQRNVRRSGKKLVYYALFVYGCPFVLVTICFIVVNFFSEYIPKILELGITLGFCWDTNKHLETFICGFYCIITVCIFSSIFLSISAARNIKRYEKDANLRLIDSESRQYNENKKWLNLYMKLFIVLFILMGIHLSTFMITWFLITMHIQDHSAVNYVTQLLNVAQCFFTFILFVWKKKIKLMLLKRFGFRTNAST
ncbi:G-protein coupled receptor Mth2-like isoform X1 [Nylanderia fulva]|uniref:G-protein coupled receptor Mth2-like isoform X1 n=1 Tax=Nylanderia fulva TaxID=613905 RepID=UPI0010FB6186|nr:G-protein coupled receptor Mth2-like isoform X1 [Nylanderia fulva]